MVWLCSSNCSTISLIMFICSVIFSIPETEFAVALVPSTEIRLILVAFSETSLAFCEVTSAPCFTSSTVVAVSLIEEAVSAAVEASCEMLVIISVVDAARTFTPSPISTICSFKFSDIRASALPRASLSERGVTLTDKSPFEILSATCTISKLDLLSLSKDFNSTPISSLRFNPSLIFIISPFAA